MNKFFTLLAAGALVAGLVTSAFSQGGAGAAGPKGQKPGGAQAGPGGPGGGQGRGQGMMRLMDQIKPPLSADQKAKIQKLNESMRAEFEKIRNAPGDRESKRPKMEALMKKRQEAMSKILTKPQQESLKKLMEEMRKRFQQGGGPGGPGRGPGGGGPGGPGAGGGKPPKGNKPPL